MIYTYSTAPGLTGWRAHLETIKQAGATFDKYKTAGMMSPYDIARGNAEMQDLIQSRSKAIIDGAIGEFRQAVGNVKAAFDKVRAAEAAEVRRWDGVKLAGEMQAVKMIIESTLKAGMNERERLEALQGMYQELKTCGDNYKQRAAAHVFGGLVEIVRTEGSTLQDLMPFNTIAKRAAGDLQTLRTTPEIQRAKQDAGAAVDALNKAGEVFQEIDLAFGTRNFNGTMGNYQLEKELGRVELTDDHKVLWDGQEWK